MPKKLKTPLAKLTLTFEPTALRIQHAGSCWIVRARQTSILGDSWIVIAATTTDREALLIANCLAEPGHFVTDSNNLKRKATT